MRSTKITMILIGAMALSNTVKAQESEKKLEVYGFLQTDYIQDFNRVNPAWDATLRPSKIPTDDGTFGSDGQSLISVRQSKFGVKGDLPTEGQNLHTQFEFDMFGVGEDEGETTIRLRHAYGEWGNWLAGQTHSLFMDIDAFPNQIDYWGPTGMVFLRNPQIRYSFIKNDTGEVAIAIEKPSNDIDPGKLRIIGDELGVNIQGDEKFPDLTLMSKMQGSWGHLHAGAILRSIGFETIGNTTNEPKDRLTGWGVNISGSIKFDKNKLILAAVYGNGIASYMNDGGTDLGPEGTLLNPRAKVIPLLGLVAFYDHYWSEKYSSSIGYSSTQVDNSSLQADDAFEKGEYALANLLYTPVKNVLVGGEALWGSRTDKDGGYGSDFRTQISFKYNFSSLDFL